jgi:hypothetical protein
VENPRIRTAALADDSFSPPINRQKLLVCGLPADSVPLPGPFPKTLRRCDGTPATARIDAISVVVVWSCSLSPVVGGSLLSRLPSSLVKGQSSGLQFPMNSLAAHLATISVLLCCVNSVHADEQRAENARQSLHSRVIVMADGQVIQGQITPRPDGYDIALPVGRMFVPSERIRFEAANMDDAYLKMRDSYSELLPETHIGIARWCITHKLWSFARRELLDAIHLDPHREDASRLLQYVERLSGNSTTNRTGSQPAVTVMPSTAAAGRSGVKRFSLGGLSSQSAQTFVRNIQPLLANKCGNGACHGPSRNSFEFTVPRFGSTPAIAERNLAAVMHLVSSDRPLESRLLVVGASQHGPMEAPVFRGRTGARQLQVLRKWVHAVSNELSPPSRQEIMTQNESPSDGSATAIRTVSGIDSGNGSSSSTASLQTPHGRSLRRDETRANAMDEIRHRTRRDPFDPAAFNNRRRSPLE